VEELLNRFGQTIKDARLAAGMTQDALAEQTGITTRYIMAIENENKLPSVKVLFKLIRVLKISADTIFYPEIQHADKKKEHLIHMIQLCDERETKVATATIQTLLDTK
jgi:transcriptional regulator with XRE-family HTH domain